MKKKDLNSNVSEKIKQPDALDLNKIIVSPSFEGLIKELKERKINLPPAGDSSIDFSKLKFPPNAENFTSVEEIKAYDINLKNGESFIINKNRLIVAYDESFHTFDALEVTGFLCVHSMIVLTDEGYQPVNYVTPHFYTKSEIIKAQMKNITLVKKDPSDQFSADYIVEKTELLIKYCPDNSLLLLDGPLIGGNIGDKTISLNKKLIQKNIIPIHIVKNSGSDLVINKLDRIKGKYNSDLHWANETLKPNQRSAFFSYKDKKSNKSKIFCYLKSYEGRSPQRIEIYGEAYQKFYTEIADVIDAIAYLIICQGNPDNPQVRPIFVAELYAKDVKSAYNLHNLMANIGTTQTINQKRGM